MITFGELRRLSLEWQTDVSTVERVYALDWLLKAVFQEPSLGPRLALTGPAALNKAYFRDYPEQQDADLVGKNELLGAELARSAELASTESGLKIRLDSLKGTQARFEYTGPLGRRSAAQPHITLRFHPTPPRLPPTVRLLHHPFGAGLAAHVRSIALEEMTANYIVSWSGKPRARDVFDLWFILTHEQDLDRAYVLLQARQLAAEKGIALRSRLDLSFRPLIERAWENALREVRNRPGFAEAESEIVGTLGVI